MDRGKFHPERNQGLGRPHSVRPSNSPQARAAQRPTATVGQDAQSLGRADNQFAPNQITSSSSPPDDIWAELDDLSGAAEANPYAAVGGSYTAASLDTPRKRVKGLTFSNVFQLVYERAFPACLTAAVVYLVLGVAASVVGNGGMFVLGWTLRFAGIDRDTIFIIFCVALPMVFLVYIACATAGLCIICNGALAAMRKKRATADELFSTGGFFFPMLVFAFSMGIIAAILGAVPQGVSLLVGESEFLVVLAAICIMPLGLVFIVGTCLAPLAIADGEGPFDAVVTSINIFLANPLTMIGVLLVGAIGYLLVTICTCGLAGILLVGLPYYLLAACYHLATR
jgi:hypothetical protein